MTTTIVIAGILGLAAITITIILSRMIHICPPNEVLIFSGGQREISGTAVEVLGKE